MQELNREFFVEAGRRGGKAAAGAKKRRTKAHYKRLSAAGVAARKARKHA